MGVVPTEGPVAGGTEVVPVVVADVERVCMPLFLMDLDSPDLPFALEAGEDSKEELGSSSRSEGSSSGSKGSSSGSKGSSSGSKGSSSRSKGSSGSEGSSSGSKGSSSGSKGSDDEGSDDRSFGAMDGDAMVE
jgi:hypothetical protein